MNKRTDKKRQKKILERVDRLTLYAFFIALIFVLTTGRQYNKTIIDFKLPISILLVSGISFGLITKTYFLKILTYQNTYGHLFLSIWTVGSFVTASLFMTNYLLSTGKTEIKKVPIVDTRGNYRGGFYVTIQLEKFEKTLTFNNTKASIDTSKFVTLEVVEGGLGFELIKNSWLSRN
jgi:hypothetical protein